MAMSYIENEYKRTHQLAEKADEEGRPDEAQRLRDVASGMLYAMEPQPQPPADLIVSNPQDMSEYVYIRAPSQVLAAYAEARSAFNSKEAAKPYLIVTHDENAAWAANADLVEARRGRLEEINSAGSAG